MKYKFITFNIHKARSTFMNNTLMQIKAALVSHPVDFMLMQELVGSSQLEVLADSIWTDHCYGQNAVFNDKHHGNAILSRYPIQKWENEDLSLDKWEQRGLLHGEIPLPNKKILHVFNVHLNLLHEDRIKQVEQVIARYLKMIPAKAPFILAGDFNDWSKELSQYFETELGLFECHKRLKKSYAKTFPNFFPFLSLDRIYAKNITPLTIHTLSTKPWNSLSDHLPLFLEFEV